MTESKDLVIAKASINFTPPPPASPPSSKPASPRGAPEAEAPPPRVFEVVLLNSSTGEEQCVVTLTHKGGDSYAAARPLKGRHDPSLALQIREAAGPPLFGSMPLLEVARLELARSELAKAQEEAAPPATIEELEAVAEGLAKHTLVGQAGRLAPLELPPWVDPADPAAAAPPKGKDAKGKADPKAKGGAPVEEVNPNALVFAQWRLQKALPPVGKQLPTKAPPLQMQELREAAYTSSPAQMYNATNRFRPRSLEMRYSAPSDLVAFETRVNGWRAELEDNQKISLPEWPPYAQAAAREANDIPSAAQRGLRVNYPPREWSHKWRPPYVPHHMRGEPLTLKSQHEYIAGCEEQRLSLYRQRISVELSKLTERLQAGRIRYKTALQGIEMLKVIRAFLDECRQVRGDGIFTEVSERNARQADNPTLEALLRLLKRIKLPFELLVPDLEYEAVKSSLMALLRRELDRRKRTGAVKKDDDENEQMRPDTVGVPGNPWPPVKKESGGALPRSRPATASLPGKRVGVLTFYGAQAPRPSSAAPWQRSS
jgi:hypothetical protein